ncbi:MAG: hypothetical protein ABI895_14825 [Deltaproteobacteria bacterium]
MTRGTLERASKAAQLLGGVLCAALGLRLMTLAIGDAQARRAPAATAPEPPAAAAPAQPSRVSARSRRVPAPERASGESSSLRLTLSVVTGPERSEVYVNGSRLGLSPYVGDYTCKQGEKLRIEVVPAREALITRSAICEGQTLSIR